jgi:hypothetical protein
VQKNTTHDKGPLKAFFDKDLILAAQRHLKSNQGRSEDCQGTNHTQDIVLVESAACQSEQSENQQSDIPVLEVLHQVMIADSVVKWRIDTSIYLVGVVLSILLASFREGGNAKVE